MYLGGYPFPHAACHEIFRRFKGRKPGFTVIVTSATSVNLAPWVRNGLIRKLISSFNGDGMPYPAPNPVYTKAYREGSLIFEHWTMLTTVLRLWAGALRIPFLPMHSVMGSSLEQGAPKSYARLRNPFGGGEVGLASALEPDLSFIHGVVGDRYGRVVLPVPYGVHVYGALAAKQGVIATVEKIISPKQMDRYTHLTMLPPDLVLAVCEAPFGAHPAPMISPGVREVESYGEDPDFVLDVRRACREDAAYDAWINRWILSARTPAEYARRLGRRRLAALHRKTLPETWKTGLRAMAAVSETPTPQEKMILAASRIIKERARQHGHQCVLAGVGASHLAAFVGYRSVRRPSFKLMVEIGTYGFVPVEGDPFIFHSRNFATAMLNTDILTVLGMCLPHPKLRSLGVLGAAQVDRFGNLNSSLIPGDKPFFLGSGGANDVASLSSAVIVVAEQSKQRFVERVPYITCPGARVVCLVTQLGVFERRGRSFVLTALQPGVEVADVQAACGWKIRVAPRLRRLPPPRRDALRLLRQFDPPRFFLGK